MRQPERVRVAILGSGFSGLAMAIGLRQAGVDDFVILERGDAIGGTWRDNHYPGCACDVPAHLYSYSFAPNPRWSRLYAPQAEIRAYIEEVAAAHGLGRFVRFGAEVRSAELDEPAAAWRVRLADRRTVVADLVVGATGGLSRPAVPRLPGLERFAGATWHSAAWRHDVPLAGKRVAVIGTGASAIQFVPRIAPEVDRLHVFQRTPPWIWPHRDRRISRFERALLAIPAVHQLYRQWLYWTHELRGIPFFLEPRLLEAAQGRALRHLHRQIRDPGLREKLTPNYLMGCKRVLLSNDYYPALARPNVELVTGGIREVTRDGLVSDDGREHPVDVIVFGTGFAVHDYLGPMKVIGQGGAELGERWRQSGAAAYLGTAVPGFPNFFTLVGPNTGLGHNSMLVMIEAQVRHVVACLRAMQDARADLIEARADATSRYNARLEARFGRTVWNSGCESWYLDAEGRNTTLWPGPSAEFVLRARGFDAAAYALRGRATGGDALPRRRAGRGHR